MPRGEGGHVASSVVGLSPVTLVLGLGGYDTGVGVGDLRVWTRLVVAHPELFITSRGAPVSQRTGLARDAQDRGIRVVPLVHAYLPSNLGCWRVG